MRLARNLMFAAIAAFAAMAFMASSASAQSIEISAEDMGHCGNVTTGANHTVSGGCAVHAVSTANAVTLTHTATPSEVVTSSCTNEFTAHITEDGVGYMPINDNTITGANPPCTITECDEAAPDHDEFEWPISGVAERAASREAILVTFCIRPIANPDVEGVGNGRCTVAVNFVTDPVTHVQTFTANETPCLETATNELSGSWQSEGSSEIELTHLHYP